MYHVVLELEGTLHVSYHIRTGGYITCVMLY